MPWTGSCAIPGLGGDQARNQGGLHLSKNVLEKFKKLGPLSENSLPSLVSQARYGSGRDHIYFNRRELLRGDRG